MNTDAEFSEDDKRIETRDWGGRVAPACRLWNANLHPLSVPIAQAETSNDQFDNKVKFSPDGSRALRPNDGDVELLDLKGERIAKLADDKNKKWVSSRFSPNGKFVLTKTNEAGYLWDANGRLVGHPMKSLGGADHFKFSDGGRQLRSIDRATGNI
ncbi:MAG TPA: WD40 repeat domain-containing protein, partial [Lacipirellulaceae bacterium]|nr:WD40 repeat domain-containing protein [Lacipirellulaceae bacterium]